MPKRFFYSCSFLLWVSLAGLFAQNARTSFKPGKLWPDDQGVHINAHGGGMLYYRDTYYWFGEYKSDDSNSALVGVSCYSSTDLYNWKREPIALSVVNDPASDIRRGCIIERPKVVYNKKTGIFVMWFHLELAGRGYDAARVGIAVSDRVTGPYRFIRSYRPNAGRWPDNMPLTERTLAFSSSQEQEWWTPEWMAAVRQGLFVKRDFKDGQMSRDMTIFVDDDGKAYHIFASEENLTLDIAELSDDYQSHTGKYIRVAPAGHNEAPAILKNDSTYFMITSGCTGWEPNAARLFTAKNIWGPWTQLKNPWVGEKAGRSFDTQGTFVFPVAGEKHAFIFMADRWRPEHPSDGRYVWIPIEFKDGVPVLNWKDEWSLDEFDR
ncbi:MAG: glycoside hydrolase family 43 protein [Bacteroidota bacterium]|nr:glycoside hydrolase family 43 protein [Bacteroidota bacterium]